MTNEVARREILERQRELIDAWLQHDEAALERLVSNDYLLVTAGEAAHVSRSEWIAGALQRYVPKTYEYGDLAARVFGDAAIVTWRYSEVVTRDLIERLYGESAPTASAETHGQDQTITIFLTDVWSRHEGSWLLVSRHASVPARAASPVA